MRKTSKVSDFQKKCIQKCKKVFYVSQIRIKRDQYQFLFWQYRNEYKINPCFSFLERCCLIFQRVTFLCTFGTFPTGWKEAYRKNSTNWKAACKWDCLQGPWDERVHMTSNLRSRLGSSHDTCTECPVLWTHLYITIIHYYVYFLLG